jgi:hypothetical protein
MKRRPVHNSKTSKTWRAKVTIAAAILGSLGLAFESAAAPSALDTAAPLSLESPDPGVAGPICVLPSSRSYQNLAGFSIAVGSILMLAPRRESESELSEAGPTRR